MNEPLLRVMKRQITDLQIQARFWSSCQCLKLHQKHSYFFIESFKTNVKVLSIVLKKMTTERKQEKS